jgi:hypothetical protein
MPHTKSLASYWRKMPQWYRLEGVKCVTCGESYFPSRSLCPTCRREGRFEMEKFSGKGKVYSYTVVHAPPQGFELHRPYLLAIIELDEGPKLTAQIVDCKKEDIKIGMPVEMTFRKIRDSTEGGIIHYGYKFKPKTEN